MKKVEDQLSLAQGFCLKTWIASVDQSSELRDPKEVFYPPAIRVKVAAPVTSNTIPSASLASAETSGPTPSDKTPTAPLTSSEKEGPYQDKAVPVAPNPPTEGQTSQVDEKNDELKEQGKELPK
ncbi:hypothetical protein SO802_010572 [Lithocarpus litseifolius]|uniref:Uncharacterized protein n=1 Tax=Lithocarpus litseifolius TaxID=425828 RepID=A0AAW2DIS4_9ROSI